MIDVTWRKFRSWSGAKIAGVKDFELNSEQKKRHMWRAVWLTAQVEGGGKFGAVQSYDGAGISAGLEHKIAVLPKTMKQGSLWGLLRKMEVNAPCTALDRLWDALKQENMYVAQDGYLREWKSGKLISAKAIRDLVAPPNGRTPRSGPDWERCKQWAILFHDLFSDEATYETQVNSTIEYLVSNNKRDEEEAYEVSVGVSHPTAAIHGKNISDEHDLAWCVYHSFTPNAPSLARRRLAASKPDGTSAWPKRLIKTLGMTNYGRWHDTFDGGNRYDRTRVYAIRSGMWPENLFNGPNAIMPQNL